MASNDTVILVDSTKHLSPHPFSTTYPFYHIPRATVLPGISDQIMAAAAPMVAYWFTSLIFYILDVGKWKWLDKYKIHDNAEVQARNLATRGNVVGNVIFQQVAQTFLGIFCTAGEAESRANHSQEMQNVALAISRILHCFVSNDIAEKITDFMGEQLMYQAYWWAIPIAQFLLAMYVIHLNYNVRF